MARELVEGLKSDILAKDDSFWERIGHTSLTSFDAAARKALQGVEPESLPLKAYEKLIHKISRARSN
jgi:hypothetical protein